MSNNKQYTQVENWSKLFGMYVSENYEIPVEKEKELAFNLLKEELAETEKAANEGNLVEVADGFADTLWVLFRAMQQFGLTKEKLEEVFDEVDRSNNSKACPTIEIAQATQEHFLAKGVESNIVERDGVFFVYRKVDGKLLKSIAYSPADIASIVNK